VRNCAGFDTGFRRLEITSRERENWRMYRTSLSADSCNSHFQHEAYSLDMEGDGGASGESTDPKVDELLCTR